MQTYLDDFRKALKTIGYSQGVIKNYPKHIENFLNYTNLEPKKIKTQHLEEYYNYLKTKPNQRKQGELLSQSHIYSQLLAIKTYFNYLETNQIIPKNPYTLKIKQTQKNQRIHFTQQEIKNLYKACETLQETIIIHLCYGCGLRRTEAQNLNQKDIDYEEKLVYIKSGKGRKRRVIPITRMIMKDLQEYNNNYNLENQEAYLVNQKETRIKGNTIYQTFKKILNRSTIQNKEHYSLHSLRHSIATHLLENEMPIEMVRNFLGHDLLRTTQIYAKVNFNQLKI